MNAATLCTATADPNPANNTTAISSASSSASTIIATHIGAILAPAGTFLCLNGATQTGATDARAGALTRSASVRRKRIVARRSPNAFDDSDNECGEDRDR